jgi:hypothetical protein
MSATFSKPRFFMGNNIPPTVATLINSIILTRISFHTAQKSLVLNLLHHDFLHLRFSTQTRLCPPSKRTTPTDLAQLWQKAFIDYNAAVGEKAKKRECQLNTKGLGLAPNLDSVRSSVDETSKAFNKWRHDGGSLDKVRSIIGDNLGYAQAIGDQIIDSATAAFPPAGAIWTVATYAIKACQSMSRDYNQLVALIGETGNFLKTLQIIEEKVPGCKIYKECVTDALTALMIVFAIQTRFMYEGRALQFWHQLKGGDDDGPDKAYANVTAAIDRLSRANGLMAVRNTEDIKNLVTHLGGKLDSLYKDMMLQFQQQGQLITDGFQEQGKLIGEGFEQQGNLVVDGFEHEGHLIQDGFQQQEISFAVNIQLLKEIRQNQLAQQTKQDSTTQTKSAAKDLPTRSFTALNKARQFYGPIANPAANSRTWNVPLSLDRILGCQKTLNIVPGWMARLPFCG